MDKPDYKPKLKAENMGMSIEQYKAIYGCMPTKKQANKPNRVEDSIQKKVIKACELMRHEGQRLSKFVNHSPNEGKRSLATGSNLKKMGMSKGYPDLAIEVAKGGYFGLRIEIKSKEGRTSDEQVAWINRLNEQGYLAVVTKGLGETLEVIERYMNMPKTRVQL